MAISSICLIISATLSIQPDRTQFFLRESFTLNCEVSGNCSGWRVMRNATEPLLPCERWGRLTGSSCTIRGTYRLDEGAYWCESDQRNRSNILNIKINPDVTLESPALPVSEGDTVTLSCRCKKNQEPKANFTTKFYRNDTFVGEKIDGELIIKKVSVSDKGFYSCEHQTEGKSPQSWLDVKAIEQHSNMGYFSPLMSETSLLCSILLFIIFTITFVACLIKYKRWTRVRAEAKRQNSDRLRPDD